MRVVIAGAGIGGLTLALALARRGVRPLILERSAVLEAAGAGVQLGPNAVRILFDLGLGEALRRVAVAPQAVSIRDGGSGRRLLRVPMGAEAANRWGAPYLQIHRADLQAVLLDALHERDAAELRLGAAVVAVDEAGVRLESGETIPAEVVVGADGVRSAVRRRLGGSDPARLLEETAWRALVPASGAPQEGQVWTFPHMHLVAYPVQAGRALNLVAATPGRLVGEGWTAPGDPADLRAAFAGAHAEVRDLLAQGAAMAVEDAEALARRLAGPGAVADRLHAYEAERKGRAERVQAASRRNGAVFHLPPPLAAAAFAGAAALGASRSLDWLYGYRPPQG